MTITAEARTANPPTELAMADYRPGLHQLRNTWFPLAHSQQVRGAVVRRAMHGEPVFLWRDRGALQVTSSSPAERDRGHLGVTAFTDPGGKYPLVDRYGYAWVWYGDVETADVALVPNIPHLPVEGLARHMQKNVIFDCSYELCCENLLDFTHADFLHAALVGNPAAETDDIDVSSTSETVTVTRRARRRMVAPMQRPFVRAKYHDMDYITVTHVRSGVNIIHVNWEGFGSVRMLHPTNPESTTRTRGMLSFNVENCSPVVRHLFPFVGHMVASQDNFALRPQNPRYFQEAGAKDMNSRFDKAGLRFRKVYQQLVSRQLQGDFSYLEDGHPSRDIRGELRL